MAILDDYSDYSILSYDAPSLVDTSFVGLDKISLADLAAAPAVATRQIVQNVRSRAFGFAVGATIFEFGQRFTRKMLSRPINKVNQMIFTGRNAPLRGLGVRI